MTSLKTILGAAALSIATLTTALPDTAAAQDTFADKAVARMTQGKSTWRNSELKRTIRFYMTGSYGAEFEDEVVPGVKVTGGFELNKAQYVLSYPKGPAFPREVECRYRVRAITDAENRTEALEFELIGSRGVTAESNFKCFYGVFRRSHS